MTSKDGLSRTSRAALDRYKASQTPGESAQNDALASVQQRILSGDIDVDWDRPEPGGGGSGGGDGGMTRAGTWLALGGTALILGGAALLSTRADAPHAADEDRRIASAAAPSSATVGALATPQASSEPPGESSPSEATREPAPATLPRAKRGVTVPTANQNATESEPSQPVSTLREEMKLLSRGQEALNGGNHAAALAAFDEHRLRFPGGALATERELKRIATLCRMGRQVGGTQRGRAHGEPAAGIP